MSEPTPPRRRFLFLAAQATWVIVAALGHRATAEDLRTIVDALRARQDHIKTAKIIWAERTFVAERSLPAQEFDNEKELIRLPLHDTTVGGFCRLVFDGANYRYEADMPMVNAAHDAIVMQKTVTILRDGIVRGHTTGEATAHPTGTIAKLGPSDFPRIIQARPPFLIFRPVHPGLFDPKKLVIGSESGTIDGRQHVIVEERENPALCSSWLDPDHDFAVSRYVFSQNGVPSLEGNIRYIQGDNHDWVPKQWSIVSKDNAGHVTLSITAVVKECAINAEIDPQEFELDFPAGTYVADLTQKTTNGYTLAYEVLKDGQTRPLKPGER